MNIRLLENAMDIRESFISHFVMPWEEFKIQHKEWIDENSKTDYPIDNEWYKNAYMWDRMSPDYPSVSMEDALAFLCKNSGLVLFMTEKDEEVYYQGENLINFVAEADVHTLAKQIEKEWYDSYRLAEQNMYDPEMFLPEDLYVFDLSMKWCVVFTHEITDYESECENPMKAAESRVCIICKA